MSSLTLQLLPQVFALNILTHTARQEGNPPNDADTIEKQSISDPGPHFYPLPPAPSPPAGNVMACKKLH